MHMLKKYINKIINRIKIEINERNYARLKKAFKMFQELSGKGDIKSITFGNGCVIELRDERKYYFDPNTRINKLYSVP